MGEKLTPKQRDFLRRADGRYGTRTHDNYEDRTAERLIQRGLVGVISSNGQLYYTTPAGRAALQEHSHG